MVVLRTQNDNDIGARPQDYGSFGTGISVDGAISRPWRSSHNNNRVTNGNNIALQDRQSLDW
ncbi:hypothetical protein A167_01326 [Alcanivorax sp. S71-1-4]|nr:hypothetical protein A167_01326 [Alcanivorax sp. S71-1-4]